MQGLSVTSLGIGRGFLRWQSKLAVGLALEPWPLEVVTLVRLGVPRPHLSYSLPECQCPSGKGLLTLSNTRKASRISSSLSVSFIFLAIMVRNSGKSMVPFPARWGREGDALGLNPGDVPRALAEETLVAHPGGQLPGALGEGCPPALGAGSPSASTSLIMSCSSASVGFCPRDLITVPSSLVVMVPSPSLSKREKASLNSAARSTMNQR